MAKITLCCIADSGRQIAKSTVCQRLNRRFVENITGDLSNSQPVICRIFNPIDVEDLPPPKSLRDFDSP
ncbi:MAG: hypothetical protein OXI17_15550 [Gammaproteobacteria bacterium]|nr:hypothetical protein [Gammaproteobacteria bacterium]MDE0480831.1 hypothetical protein [Gammaproteobacteria bacterium]MDE0510030.1 hypothetical protein [Gammaproteobacteria bacterium]